MVHAGAYLETSRTPTIEIFFSVWVCFREHSRFTWQQGKGETISLTPLYHFHPLQRHLDINRPITAESSPLHTASSRTRTRNLWFSSLPSVVACTYNSATLEAEFRNGVGSVPVGGNCPWVDCVTTCNPALGEEPNWDLTVNLDSKSV